MLTYIIIILVVVVVLAVIFIPLRRETPSDFQEESFRHSGHQWVFNGLLSMDNPPERHDVFTDYDGEIQLVTKKGFVQFEMTVSESMEDGDLGLFEVEAFAKDGKILIRRQNRTVGMVATPQASFCADMANRGGTVPAYCFIARRPATGMVYGAVCISK